MRIQGVSAEQLIADRLLGQVTEFGIQAHFSTKDPGEKQEVISVRLYDEAKINGATLHIHEDGSYSVLVW